ncbi:NAD(P)H-binding protein [Dactylosporangium sp. CA-233914]|uniref:NAD(P)H-binding protein n=1 Tax=Dactylosporangium sp. CA-233914 TaxID=3239934 RepID=UPI003D9412BF
MSTPVLVFGGGGQVGRAVVDELLAAGATVRATGRDPGRLRLPSTVEKVRADLTDPDTLPAALAGVRKVFLYAVPHGVDNFVAAARDAGVEHVVLLSSDTVLERIPARKAIADMHKVVEAALDASGLATTYLRPDNFAGNVLLWGWAESIRAEGVVRFAYPESHSDAIHERDIAAVAAVALTRPGHEGGRYLITGPESVTQRRQAELIAAAIGRPVRVEELTPEQARQVYATIVPEWVLDATLGYWAATDGVPYEVNDLVRRLTGRSARTFAQWARDHADDFRPSRPNPT